jgi:hypothetical protein
MGTVINVPIQYRWPNIRKLGKNSLMESTNSCAQFRHGIAWNELSVDNLSVMNIKEYYQRIIIVRNRKASDSQCQFTTQSICDQKYRKSQSIVIIRLPLKSIVIDSIPLQDGKMVSYVSEIYFVFLNVPNWIIILTLRVMKPENNERWLKGNKMVVIIGMNVIRLTEFRSTMESEMTVPNVSRELNGSSTTVDRSMRREKMQGKQSQM